MYEARGWHVFGGGRDQLAATAPLELNHHGNQLAFLGCNEPRSGMTTIRNGPNVAFCDFARLAWQVRDLRARGFVPIVSIQHEEVPIHTPPDSLVRDFRRLADAGAAVVFGSQAHVAHPFDTYAGAYLHYGAGNFIFDQPWTSTRDAVADRLYIHRGRLLTVQRLYTRIEEQGRPRPMTTDERTRFLALLDEARGDIPPPRARRPRPEPAGIPDSFLVGTKPVYIRVLPDGTARVTSARGVPRKQLAAALAAHLAARYGTAGQPVAIR
jgi:poly-gamma-glutamate synthesis protein (capsule biosynthesis protein)